MTYGTCSGTEFGTRTRIRHSASVCTYARGQCKSCLEPSLGFFSGCCSPPLFGLRVPPPHQHQVCSTSATANLCRMSSEVCTCGSSMFWRRALWRLPSDFRPCSPGVSPKSLYCFHGGEEAPRDRNKTNLSISHNLLFVVVQQHRAATLLSRGRRASQIRAGHFQACHITRPAHPWRSSARSTFLAE